MSGKNTATERQNTQPDRLSVWKEKCRKRIRRFMKPPPRVAILRLSGVIGNLPHTRSGLTLGSLNDDIEKAFNLNHLVAVALSINSPGGSPVQSEQIARRIRTFAEEKDIPVFSFIDDVGASGGYWLACAGEEIYASPMSIVGSIGVIASGFGFQDAIKKLGVERRIYTQGHNKSILDPFEKEKEEDIAILKEVQKDIHERFIETVKDRRGKKLKGKDHDLFSGAFWSGKKALELGLVDHLNDMHSVLREKYGQEVDVRHVIKPKSWMGKKFGIMQGVHLWNNLPEMTLSTLEERALWSRYGL